MRVPVGACEHEETIARGVVLAVDDVVNGHHAGQSLASIVKLGDLFVLHTHNHRLNIVGHSDFTAANVWCTHLLDIVEAHRLIGRNDVHERSIVSKEAKRLDGLVGGRDCVGESGTSAIAWFPTAQALWSTPLGCGEEERTRNEGVVFVGLRRVKHADQAIGRAGE